MLKWVHSNANSICLCFVIHAKRRGKSLDQPQVVVASHLRMGLVPTEVMGPEHVLKPFAE